MSENAGANQPIHVYDGIEELDNNLPNWWLGILWGTIAFSFGYWMYFGVFQLGPDQLGEYSRELEAVTAKGGGGPAPLDEQTLLALAQSSDDVSEGTKAYQQNCAACHGAEGQGVIGPNLTDAHWLYGGSPLDIHRVIAEGSVEKGMPAWERTLGSGKVRQISAYVLTLKGKSLPGKAPQGEPEP